MINEVVFFASLIVLLFVLLGMLYRDISGEGKREREYQAWAKARGLDRVRERE